jgi:CheY-like chemotaxis protein
MQTKSKKPILLLVEDADDDTFLFKRAFAKSGADFSISDARNGAEAIEFLKNAAQKDLLPKVVFLDLKMPVINGFEVLSWMKRQPFSENVPVIVVSGSAQDEDKLRAAELGAQGYLVKPIKADEIIAVLKPITSEIGSSAPNDPGAAP